MPVPLKYAFLVLTLFASGWGFIASANEADTLNGFDISNATIPVAEILKGGPPRDGIPSLDVPKFVSPSTEHLWKADDRVMTFEHGTERYAYPVGILNWHEIINQSAQSAGEAPVLITFCPLCGTGMAFDPRVDGKLLTFGVSGLLYNSDLLMYDHQTQSLWSQLFGEAVSGPMVGARLTQLATSVELFARWAKRTPDGHLLSTDTGYERDYRRSPYGDYDQSKNIFFPVSNTSQLYHPKTWVVGIELGGEARAWPFPELESAPTTLEETVGGQKIIVRFDKAVPTARIETTSGEHLPSTQAFWFAWYAFHPDTSVYVSSARE